MTHRHEAIRAYTSGILRARQAYWRENHCACGEFVPLAPKQADRARACDLCRLGVAA